MKTIKNTAFFALIFISGNLMAQSKDGVKIGINAGVNLSSFALSGSDNDSEMKDAIKPLTNFSFGGYASIPVSGKFSVQAGLNLSGKGTRAEATVTDQFVTVTGKRKTPIMYVEVPINAVFNFGGFYVGAGPYVGYGIAGKTKTDLSINGQNIPELSEPERDLKFGSGEDDDLKPFDFGANILAGYRLSNGISFGLNYGLGLANIEAQKTPNSKTSNRVASFLVGFSF